MSDMDKYINNLSAEFKRLSYEDMAECSDTEKLLYLYAYYHYFNAIAVKYPTLSREISTIQMLQIK